MVPEVRRTWKQSLHVTGRERCKDYSQCQGLHPVRSFVFSTLGTGIVLLLYYRCVPTSRKDEVAYGNPSDRKEKQHGRCQKRHKIIKVWTVVADSLDIVDPNGHNRC